MWWYLLYYEFMFILEVFLGFTAFYCRCMVLLCSVFFFQAEDGIRDLVRSRGLGDVYKRQAICFGSYFAGRAVIWDVTRNMVC